MTIHRADHGRYWDHSWNPVTGCDKVSDGCRFCWAEAMAKRFPASFGGDFHVRLHPQRLREPFTHRKPQVIYCCLISDLFHPSVPNPFICDVLNIIRLNPQHTFLLTTKRPARLVAFLKAQPIPLLPNLWLGTSIENQAMANERVPRVVKLAAARWNVWLSVEPMLGPVDLCRWMECTPCGPDTEVLNAAVRPMYQSVQSPGINPIRWIVCGGESGPQARPCNPDWVRSLRDQCRAAEVPFFLKSLGRGKGRVLDEVTYDDRPFN